MVIHMNENIIIDAFIKGINFKCHGPDGRLITKWKWYTDFIPLTRKTPLSCQLRLLFDTYDEARESLYSLSKNSTTR